jgi:hypothetical protein
LSLNNKICKFQNGGFISHKMLRVTGLEHKHILTVADFSQIFRHHILSRPGRIFTS